MTLEEYLSELGGQIRDDQARSFVEDEVRCHIMDQAEAYESDGMVREDALEKYPGLEEALMLMDGLLSDSEMAGLNAKVEVDGLDETAVAHDYLVEKGILKG